MKCTYCGGNIIQIEQDTQVYIGEEEILVVVPVKCDNDECDFSTIVQCKFEGKYVENI